ncbi:MAG: hypothetical protein OEZ01_11965 [Candidatus Heimdallarchaeota archaeon]|nr:hypothetical protein [Candidatus Heimdallarchaeota archaeon]
MTGKIAILTNGVSGHPLLNNLIQHSDLDISIICSNILDFEVPPIVENAAYQWHRHELRNVLRSMKPSGFKISSSLKNLLRENDRLELDEIDLSITSLITQIEQNSKDYTTAYSLLLGETDIQNLSLIPLVEKNPNLYYVKNKKYSPLRYYYIKGDLLKDPPERLSIQKKLLDDKKASIANEDKLHNLKLNELAYKAIADSDLLIILISDVVSFGILLKAIELEKQMKNIKTPIALVWPFNGNEEINKREAEISTLMEFNTGLEDVSSDIAMLTDYIVINKSLKQHMETLREVGCQVLLSELWDEEGNIPDSLIQNLLNIGSISVDSSKKKQNNKETKDTSSEDEKEKILEKLIFNDALEKPSAKKISQLSESPEEAGFSDIKTSRILNETSQDNTENNLEQSKKLESEVDTTPETLEESENETMKTEELVNVETFDLLDEESWIDGVKRAIDLGYYSEDEIAINWLIVESNEDNDKEIQIAENIIYLWINSRSSTERRSGADLISKVAAKHRKTYLQIIHKHLMESVTSKQEDKRRNLVLLIGQLFDIDIELSQMLIKELTRDLTILRDKREVTLIEFSKLTLLQLVIGSRRFSRLAVRELLTILESHPTIASETWNILIAFDAGLVGIELVTNFSFNKAEEIIRKSNILRFTGSYYSTITKILQCWKEGDKAEISKIAGTILPEETLRKFDRIELARKLDKLKMVQLSTLADSLGKDVETVERLITELIVNDELHAEMKLIDSKMYLVALED